MFEQSTAPLAVRTHRGDGIRYTLVMSPPPVNAECNPAGTPRERGGLRRAAFATSLPANRPTYPGLGSPELTPDRQRRFTEKLCEQLAVVDAHAARFARLHGANPALVEATQDRARTLVVDLYARGPIPERGFRLAFIIGNAFKREKDRHNLLNRAAQLARLRGHARCAATPDDLEPEIFEPGCGTRDWVAKQLNSHRVAESIRKWPAAERLDLTTALLRDHDDPGVVHDLARRLDLPIDAVAERVADVADERARKRAEGCADPTAALRKRHQRILAAATRIVKRAGLGALVLMLALLALRASDAIQRRDIPMTESPAAGSGDLRHFDRWLERRSRFPGGFEKHGACLPNPLPDLAATQKNPVTGAAG